MEDLYWPTINATKSVLANELRKMGYILTHCGRSCFEARNYYKISTTDDELTVENIKKIEKDIAEAKIQAEKNKLKAFDDYFDNESCDTNKVYAVIETGYDYHQTRLADDKYSEITCLRIACTADHRQDICHTYLSLMINEERMKDDKRNTIVLYVPKSMIGLIIGKNGENIKSLQNKYGKKFIVKDVQQRLEDEKKQQKKAKILENRKKYEKQQKENCKQNSSCNLLSSAINAKFEK